MATPIKDPYPGFLNANVLTTPAPQPGEPPDGSASLLSIWVPAESSAIDMGAAGGGADDLPGIRIETATHVHMTAVSPLTTISLGAPGGKLGGDGVGGLSIHTDGDKKEHVVGVVTELYDNTKTETVTLALKETYQNTKDETVTLAVTETYLAKKHETVGGALTEDYQATKTENIKGPLAVNVTSGSAKYVYASTLETTSKARTETVTGSWTAEVTDGDLKFHATGDAKVKSEGDYILFHCNTKKVTTGMDTGITFGAKNGLVVGMETSTRAGVHIDTRAGMHVQSMYGVKVEKKGMNVDSTSTLQTVQCATRVVKGTAALIYVAAVQMFK
jgi:hypothetical protein